MATDSNGGVGPKAGAVQKAVRESRKDRKQEQKENRKEIVFVKKFIKQEVLKDADQNKNRFELSMIVDLKVFNLKLEKAGFDELLLC